MLGATEVEVVTNIGLLKDGNIKYFTHDIFKVLSAIKNVPDNKYMVKFILENCYLTIEEIIMGTGIIADAAEEFPKINVLVSTSTDYGMPYIGPLPEKNDGAVIDEVCLMKEVIKKITKEEYNVGIKVTGKIENMETALIMMKACGLEPDNIKNTKENYQDLFRIGTDNLDVLRSSSNYDNKIIEDNLQ